MFNWGVYRETEPVQAPNHLGHHLTKGDDEFLFEATLKTPEPALPETDGAEGSSGGATPSQHWQQQHGVDGPNPADSGPPSFGEPLDTVNYPEQMNQNMPDEKLLAPGEAIPDNDLVRDTGGFSTTSKKDPRAWLMGSEGKSDSDIAKAAKAYLEAGTFSPQEQLEIINEGENVKASNLADLRLEGSHYEALEAALKEAEETQPDEFWLA